MREGVPVLPGAFERRCGARNPTPARIFPGYWNRGLFDMVNVITRGIRHASLVPERHRSKTQRDCVGVQRLVGWEHPRRARLGLIEASTSTVHHSPVVKPMTPYRSAWCFCARRASSTSLWLLRMPIKSEAEIRLLVRFRRAFAREPTTISGTSS